MAQLNLYSYGANVGSYEKYPDDSIIYDIRNEHTEHVKIPEGRTQTGLDESFRKKLFKNENFANLLHDYKNNIVDMISSAKTNSTINIVIMCHRGQHRSVSIVEELYEYFKNNEKIEVRKEHLSMD